LYLSQNLLARAQPVASPLQQGRQNFELRYSLMGDLFTRITLIPPLAENKPVQQQDAGEAQAGF